jgi:nitrate reductase NapAB chaperone NapD
MEKAIVLGTLSHSVPRDIIEKFKNIPGITDANLIFGPYDFYTLIEVDTKEKLSNAVLKIRSTNGVLSSMTCYVVSLYDIRPSYGPSYEERNA